MKKDKNFSIFGCSYGLLGDLVAGLPMLTYFEKKYPNSYKYWVIEKKCAFCAPIYFNHPLIDRIHITQNWDGFGREDLKLANKCDLRCTISGWKHSVPNYWNELDMIEETARIAGIWDLKEVLTEEELYPKLYKWFDVGFIDEKADTYSKQMNANKPLKTIGIYPFATAGDNTGRSPSIEWWSTLINKLCIIGYKVFHFGRPTEPTISALSDRYVKYTHKSYMEQLQIALSTEQVIGTDSGAMWVICAYNHPSITLMTNWLPNHYENFMAIEPKSKKNFTLFEQGGCDNIKHEKVLTAIRSR